MDEWLKVGEVGRRTGVTVRTLHHYDSLGLLRPSGRSGGDHRLYSVADLRRLLTIGRLRSLGLSLAEVAAALDDPGFDPASLLAAHLAEVEDRLVALEQLRRRLIGLRERSETGVENLVEAIALTEELRHPEVHRRIRAALDPIPVPVGELMERLLKEPDEGVRGVLVWALAHHGRRALAPLLAAADHDDAGVRLTVAYALGKMGEPDSLSALVGLLAAAEPEVRSAAALALGQLGLPAAAGALAARLGDDDGRVRAGVSDALVELGESALTALTRAGSDPRAPVRTMAAETLGRMPGPAAVALLGRLVDDDDAEVRLAALWALADCPGAEAEAALDRAAASPDPAVRILAERIGRPPAAGTR